MSFKSVPAVEADDLSRPFWDACKRHELIVQRCKACSSYQYPPMHYCGNCQSGGLEWQKSPGRGVIHSVSTVHRPQSPAFDAPYVVAIVALDEGWHIVTNIVGCEPSAAKIDKRVKVVFTAISGDGVLPHFKLVPDGEARSDSTKSNR